MNDTITASERAEVEQPDNTPADVYKKIQIFNTVEENQTISQEDHEALCDKNDSSTYWWNTNTQFILFGLDTDKHLVLVKDHRVVLKTTLDLTTTENVEIVNDTGGRDEQVAIEAILDNFTSDTYDEHGKINYQLTADGFELLVPDTPGFLVVHFEC